MKNQEIHTHGLSSCEVTDIALMDQDFARHHQIPLQEVQEPCQFDVTNGRPIESGDITHVAKAGIEVQDHQE